MVEPRQPLAVLMSGAPGAGKTTLAHALGDRLRVPVIEKDRLRAGYLRTIGTVSPGVSGPELFYEVMEHLLGCGISVVGDMALFPDISERDVAARLAPVAEPPTATGRRWTASLRTSNGSTTTCQRPSGL